MELDNDDVLVVMALRVGVAGQQLSSCAGATQSLSVDPTLSIARRQCNMPGQELVRVRPVQ